MISNSDCFLHNSCGKYLKGNIECENSSELCMKLFKLDKLYSNALLTGNQRNIVPLWVEEGCNSDIQAFEQLNQIGNNIEEFIASGGNIYLHSAISGNGKTSWSIKLMQKYFSKIWPKAELECKGLFISVPRFLIALKDNISNNNEYCTYIKNNVLNADLVIWDDIATKGTTVFETEHLLSIIDARINNNKSNIFTSNVSNDELYNLVGARLASRIANLSTNIELFGADKRGIK